ncbi:unnamed protein product [Ophioblennius macclurei]
MSTPQPGKSAHTSPPFTNSDLVTRIGASAPHTDIADLAALVGGIISVVLLVLICVIAILLWCMSRQKGSYATNENDDDDNVDEDDDDDDESVSSDRALQMKEPLKPKEDD